MYVYKCVNMLFFHVDVARELNRKCVLHFLIILGQRQYVVIFFFVFLFLTQLNEKGVIMDKLHVCYFLIAAGNLFHSICDMNGFTV